jgi:hypothetical protein
VALVAQRLQTHRSLHGELIKSCELNVSDSDYNRLVVVRRKNTHQLANEDVAPLSRPLFRTFSVFRFGHLS